MKSSSLLIFHRNWKLRKNLKFINGRRFSKRFGALIFVQAILIAVSEPTNLCDNKNSYLWYLNMVVSALVYIEMLLKIIKVGLIWGNTQEKTKGYLCYFQNIFEFVHNNFNLAWLFIVSGSCDYDSLLTLVKVVNSFAGLKMILR